MLHQRYNLINVGTTPAGVRYNPIDYPYRTADGSYNDPFNSEAGNEDAFFGRNMMPSPQNDQVITDISLQVVDASSNIWYHHIE